jgi:hypothetical protein
VKTKFRASLCAAACALVLGVASAARAQELGPRGEQEFGPVVRAYLGYLRAEQLVTDARESRREVSAAYVRRNSNRITALRREAIQIARTTHNDYLPELYAVTRDELGTLFEHPPSPATFRVGEVLNNTFRYLGQVRANEPFYVFARLDIYEQADLIKREEERQKARAGSQATTEGDANGTRSNGTSSNSAHANGASANGSNADGTSGGAKTRPRRVGPPSKL